MEIDHEKVSTVILLPSPESLKGFCQLHCLAKVCFMSSIAMVNCLFKLVQEKVWFKVNGLSRHAHPCEILFYKLEVF